MIRVSRVARAAAKLRLSSCAVPLDGRAASGGIRAVVLGGGTMTADGFAHVSNRWSSRESLVARVEVHTRLPTWRSRQIRYSGNDDC